MAKAAPTIGDPYDWRQARAVSGPESSRRRLVMRLVKFVLPLVALGFLAVMIAWPRFTQKESQFELDYSDIAKEQDDLSMSSPRFTGADAKNNPYMITANAATQDANDRELVRLDMLQADLAQSDGSWLSVNATSGLMHNGLQTLQLDGQVEAYSDLGYAFYTSSARLDLDAGSLQADQPVRLQGPAGHLRANTMLATERGQHLHFQGAVKVTIYPKAGGAG